ncbi:MAG: TetR family transcriptional regulator [Hyphomicrobiales bacterium]|nr:TetR family transcriptional regulator [Hyphomicrobiales bacterium]
MQRRTQAERTDASRRKLIAATIEVMRRRGYSGLTTAEVAEVAGLSRGALLHHFPSRHELVLATMRHMNDLVRVESQRRASEAATGTVDPLDGAIRDAKDFFFSDFFFVSLAVAMSDVYDEDLRRQTRPLSRDSRLAVEAAWVDALVARGIERPLASRVMTITLSIVRGFSIRVFIDDNRKHFDEVLETWKDMVRVYLASPDRDETHRGAAPAEATARKRRAVASRRKA